MNRHHLTAAALLAAFAASNSIGQTTVPGDVVVAPGGTLIINDDTTYTGTLTIGAGAQVVVDTGYQINIADGATLTINGTDAEPVVFFPINGSWDGLKLLDGSTADMSYAYITDVQQYGIVADDADVSMVGCEIFDASGFVVTQSSWRYPVVARNGTDLSVDQCVFGPFRGRSGGTGGNGGTGAGGGTGGAGQGVTGIDARNVNRLHVTNSRFFQVEGGNGGNGGSGGGGSTGSAGSNAGIGGSPGSGGTGGAGGRGGNGGAGGSTIMIYANGSADTLIAQNIFERPGGGKGGVGGRGGNGGRGGRGGTGAPGVFGNGGTGGAGGRGGRGGDGGTGGTSGALQLVRVIDPGNAAIVASNTVYEAAARTGGAGGSPGSGGGGGAGGAGGTASSNLGAYGGTGGNGGTASSAGNQPATGGAGGAGGRAIGRTPGFVGANGTATGGPGGNGGDGYTTNTNGGTGGTGGNAVAVVVTDATAGLGGPGGGPGPGGNSGASGAPGTVMGATIIALPGGSSPQGVAISPDGATVYVADPGIAQYTRIDTTDYFNVTTGTLGYGGLESYLLAVGATRIASVCVDGGQACGLVAQTDGTVVESYIFDAGSVPGGVALSSDETTAYFSSVDGDALMRIVEGTGDKAEYSLTGGPAGMAFSQDGSLLYVALSSAGDVAVMDAFSPGTFLTTISGAGLEPFAVAVDPAASNLLYVVDRAGGAVRVFDTSFYSQVGSAITVGTSPVALAVSSDGTKVYVANNGSNSVSVIDVSDPLNPDVTTLAVGTQPYGVAVSPDGTRLYVAMQGADTVWAIAI
ncbi:MAG: beta-propeller fold lactonase family protein [Phycisphaerales bacterium]|nr:beta-propeller fold lactonase family protein [Phycisphaerales bacterium]